MGAWMSLVVSTEACSGEWATSSAEREPVRMRDWPAVLISLMFAIWGFYGAYAFRGGRMRGMARWYFHRWQPSLVRNLPFYLLPTGMLAASSAVAIALSELTDPWAAPVAAIAAWIGIGSGIMVLVWVARPPAFFKPEWLRREEAEREDMPDSVLPS